MPRVTSPLLAALVAVAVVGCQKKTDPNAPVRGSGVGSKVVRSMPPFSKLRVGGSVRAEVTVGKPASLELLGDDNLLPLVPSRVDAGMLVIQPTGVLKPTQPLVARITTPSLDAVEIIVAAKGIVTGVSAQHFVVRVAGGGSVDVDGSSHTLEVVAKGAARADLRDFTAASAHVSSSDATRVEVGRVDTLEVDQRGPSVVTYPGTPEIKRAIVPPARLIQTRP